MWYDEEHAKGFAAGKGSSGFNGIIPGKDFRFCKGTNYKK
jgi:hypothetical protein